VSASTGHGHDRSKSGKILVIDDDEIALQAIADLLELAGFEVHTLVSPIGATQVIATQGIVAAVIDLNMPVMRGDRFIALVRSWDRIRDLPIVLISGESSTAIREAAAQLPGVAVVTKAQMGDQLVRTLRQELSGRAAPDGNPAASQASARSGTATPARSLATQARTANTAFREFVARRPGALQAVHTAFDALRGEAQLIGATNITQIVASALEVLDLCAHRKDVPAEIQNAVSEMLATLSSSEAERGRAFDQSLALTLHRSRLERVRQNLK